MSCYCSHGIASSMRYNAFPNYLDHHWLAYTLFWCIKGRYPPRNQNFLHSDTNHLSEFYIAIKSIPPPKYLSSKRHSSISSSDIYFQNAFQNGSSCAKFRHCRLCKAKANDIPRLQLLWYHGRQRSMLPQWILPILWTPQLFLVSFSLFRFLGLPVSPLDLVIDLYSLDSDHGSRWQPYTWQQAGGLNRGGSKAEWQHILSDACDLGVNVMQIASNRHHRDTILFSWAKQHEGGLLDWIIHSYSICNTCSSNLLLYARLSNLSSSYTLIAYTSLSYVRLS